MVIRGAVKGLNFIVECCRSFALLLCGVTSKSSQNIPITNVKNNLLTIEKKSTINEDNSTPARRTRSKSKSPAPVPTVVSRSSSSTRSSLKKTYKPIFDKIDTDNNGSIDEPELYTYLSSLMPKLTPADVKSMMKEADVNDDGVISLEEFSTIMVNAEGQDSLWGNAQKTMWSELKHNVQQTVQVLDTATAPLKKFTKQHSFLDKSGEYFIASVGLRFFAHCFTFIFVEYVLSNFIPAAITIVTNFLTFNWMEEVMQSYSGMFTMLSLNIWDTITGDSTYVQRITMKKMEIEKMCNYFVNVIYIGVIFLCHSSGRTVSFALFGMQVIDEVTKKPIGFIRMQGFADSVLKMIFTLILSPYGITWDMVDFIVLLWSGKSLTERITKTLVIVPKYSTK